MELDIANWKKFKIGDIFKKKNIKKFSATPIEKGNIPFISSTSFNNGVSFFCNEEPLEGNCITVSTNGHCFDCFYHEEPIVISSDVEVLYNENLNKYNALFICTILHKESIKWQYGRKPKNDKVFQTVIKLPVLDEKTPNWEYMSKYIKEVIDKDMKNNSSIGKSFETKNKFLSEKLDTLTWKKFKLTDVFYCEYGVNLELNSLEKTDPFVDKNAIAFVGRSSKNNGITAYVKKTEDIPQHEGLISLAAGGSVLSTFLQPIQFYSGRDTYVLKSKENISIYSKLFICTIIKNERYRYAFGRQVNKDLDNFIIKLPVTKDGKPDYEYMEKYIKSLPYGDKI